MAIWIMEPLDSDNIQWQVSQYQGKVVIRADSEERARDLCGYCFWQSGATASANMAGPPWNRPNLVRVAPYAGEEYIAAGDEEILAPPEAVALWRKYQA